MVQDQQATTLLGSRWSGPTPISVKGDGKCLFNAISVALFGHENASSEIRLKTLFQMSDHAMFYERVHAKTQIPAISPTFAQATKHCQQNGNWACAWTFHATLPAQLNLCIQLLTALLMLTSESLTPHSNLVPPGLAKRYL